MLEKWFLHPAAWWQFWYPQSGALGGSIGGAIFVLLPIIVLGRW